MKATSLYEIELQIGPKMTTKLRFQKFVPIDREHPIYEVLDGEDIIFDVTLTEKGLPELSFFAEVSGRIYDLAEVEKMLSRLKELLAAPN
jgi:hypothetical protein